MTTPQPPQGLFGLPGLPDLSDLLPPVVTDAIKNTVGSIMDGSGPEPGSPQPEGEKPIPVEAGSRELSDAVKAIDAVLSAIDFILKLGFVIPDNIEKVLGSLASALRTVRGWLD